MVGSCRGTEQAWARMGSQQGLRSSSLMSPYHSSTVDLSMGSCLKEGGPDLSCGGHSGGQEGGVEVRGTAGWLRGYLETGRGGVTRGGVKPEEAVPNSSKRL